MLVKMQLILPLVLYVCGVRCFMLMEERKMRVFENRVLREKCEP
jgi:hypothetical protein